MYSPEEQNRAASIIEGTEKTEISILEEIEEADLENVPVSIVLMLQRIRNIMQDHTEEIKYLVQAQPDRFEDTAEIERESRVYPIFI